MDKFEYQKIDWKVPIERSILIDKNIDNPSLRLYLILLSYARDKITAFPSRETLAEDMGCSVRNVDLIKNKLKKIGLLDWKTYFNGTNKYNVYNLLQYQPIKKKQKTQETTETQNYKKPEQKITIDTKIQEVIDIYKKSYKDFCEKSKDLKEVVTSGWIENSDYIPSQGDLRNLQWYSDTYGEASLKKLGISFKFLGSYLRDAIEYGDFYTNQGAELVPTISLFTKAKLQHDKIMRFALDELKKKASQENFKEVS
jgi:hypothetical protein